MAITQLTSQQVQPDFTLASQVVLTNPTVTAQTTPTEQAALNSGKSPDLLTWQPRLASALSLLCEGHDFNDKGHQQSSDHALPHVPRFMLLKAPESEHFFSLLKDAVATTLPNQLTGFAYHFNDNKITLTQAHSPQDNFAAKSNCLASLWVESETLFGCVRQPENGSIKLQAGLVHNANGGVLILGLRALLAEPNLWERLRQMVMQREYRWFSTDDSHPLPLTIPSMPLDLRIILVGDRVSLADLQELEPEFYYSALYAEFENVLPIKNESATDTLTSWAHYLQFIAREQNLPELDNSALPMILKEATRFTGDHYYLPLSVDWVTTLLTNSSRYATAKIDASAVKQALHQQKWRDNYLVERLQDEIFTNQIMINTKDQVIGQINGLSVIEYPGYPKAIGEPTRLSCLVHFGDGELIDIERKTELAGSIHSKGMMIMQAFIMSEFAITHQLPFSASLVFEQSYSEIDGDSASLAGLCVLMSALAQQPIDQQLAVTGSVDQFGHVQSIGGVNEKIEGFFAVCKHQGLTGQQGVIIPASNQRHLCLSDEVITAIEQNQFAILTVEHISEALHLLTGIPYKDNHVINLYKLIHARIQQLMLQEKKNESWFSRWRNFF
ncbi:Lon protease family protein [Orbaceae bacterium ESL0727]|nr:Lon protease family protein [Orbaceae bacterium ESL0727]